LRAFRKKSNHLACFFWPLVVLLLLSVSASAEKIIPGSLIAMETNRAVDYLLLVEKETQTLFVYAYDGQFRELKRFRCSTGENLGSKKQSGDRKTPEGVYFFNNRFTKRDLTPIYGTRAFPIDYPNYMDRFAGKNGSAIWVHGTNKKLKDRDTNGCVAMINEDIDALDKYIDLHHTPIIIQKRIQYVNPGESEPVRVSLIQFLRTLENLLMYGDAKAFFSHYNYISDYIPKWWDKWSQLRSDVKSLYPEAVIQLLHPIILKHDRIYVVLVDQIVSSGSIYQKTSMQKIKPRAYMAGKKKLFIVRYKEQWRIVGEEYQTSEVKTVDNYPLLIASSGIVGQSQPLISASSNKADDTKVQATVYVDHDRTIITQMVDNWLEAWRSKNIEQYGQFYADDFMSQNKNKQQWIDYKDRLNKKYEFIQVDRKDISIHFYKRYKNRAKVYFNQTYKSNMFSAFGRKTLILKYDDGQWKIYREYWKNI
jgi:murein L,D-transpeptidase YafK/ketosteroid isomerase-like protein